MDAAKVFSTNVQRFCPLPGSPGARGRRGRPPHPGKEPTGGVGSPPTLNRGNAQPCALAVPGARPPCLDTQPPPTLECSARQVPAISPLYRWGNRGTGGQGLRGHRAQREAGMGGACALGHCTESASQHLGESCRMGSWTLGWGGTQQHRVKSVRQGGQRQDGLGNCAPASQRNRGTVGRCHDGKSHQTAHGAEATSSIRKRSQQTREVAFLYNRP